MRRVICAVVSAALLGGCSLKQGMETANKEVAQFHRQLDEGRYSEIYKNSAPDMRGAADETKLTRLLTAVHTKLGAVHSTAQQGINVNTSTQGSFISASYATKFAKGSGQEQFVYRIGLNGKPQLAGYHINSDELIYN